MRLTIGFLLLSLCFSSLLMAKIYKYKDSYGRTHYVDDISKVPNSKVNQAKLMTGKFLKTGNEVIDKYRKTIAKKGVLYKELNNQKSALILWGSLIVNYGYPEFKLDLSRIESISMKRKNGKKLTRKQRKRVARQLASFFKAFENDWPAIYEEVHFKTTGNPSLDTLRKTMKTVKTDKNNIESRIKLLEAWKKLIVKNEKADIKLVEKRLTSITSKYDTPKPDIYMLSRYVDQTLRIFEKEFRK